LQKLTIELSTLFPFFVFKRESFILSNFAGQIKQKFPRENSGEAKITCHHAGSTGGGKEFFIESAAFSSWLSQQADEIST